MSETEWFACDDPDLLLEALQGKVNRQHLVDFVRRCWERIENQLPPHHGDCTVVDQFAAAAFQQSDHDAVLYASEAALKAARWARDLTDERRKQASLLRQVVGRPPS
ncbi:MAG TPA: hypothetical protein VE988_24620 [Gemmataceae bacterium]|nr:hypothetical protein [Gemmataceae bacterium]